MNLKAFPKTLSNLALIGVAIAVVFALSACSTGKLSVKQQHFLTAESDGHAVHYRVKVKANTYLSDAKFRQGWFPAEAVDAVFSEGDAAADGGTYDTREKLKRQINTTILELRKRYHEELLKDPPDSEKLKSLLKSEFRLRSVATKELGEFNLTRTMEFNPISALVTNRSGDKLVLILSANPDDIIDDIAGFAEEQETKATIKGLTDFIRANARKDIDEKEAVLAVEVQRNIRVGTLIDATLSEIDPNTLTRDQALALLAALRDELDNGGTQ